MSDTNQKTAAPTEAPANAPAAGGQVDLTVQDLNTLRTVIDIATQRGAFKANDINPKKFIMFTDGYTWDNWGDEDYCDTVFVIHSHHDKNLQAPFGVTTHYEDETKSS